MYVRVSANRILKRGEEFNGDIETDGDDQGVEKEKKNPNVIVASEDFIEEDSTDAPVSDSEPEIEVEQILDHERTEPSVIDEQLIVNQTS